MNKFLIAVDLQNDFIDGALGTPEAQAIVEAAAKKILDFDGAVFATLDTHEANYLSTQEGAKLPVPHCIRGTQGWMLNDAIRAALEAKGAQLVEKPSFGSLELPQLLRAAGAGEDCSIELIGLCTDICVISNALILKANFPEAQISVDASCCAGVSPATHEAALTAMRCCQIDA